MSRKFKIVCCSGYFDPLHRGHVEYLKNAKLLGDKLIVILNNDSQRSSTISKTPQEDRKVILESIKYVDEVFLSVDQDSCVCKSIEIIKPDIFANGNNASINEENICKKLNIKVVNSVGNMLHMHDLLAELR